MKDLFDIFEIISKRCLQGSQDYSVEIYNDIKECECYDFNCAEHRDIDFLSSSFGVVMCFSEKYVIFRYGTTEVKIYTDKVLLYENKMIELYKQNIEYNSKIIFDKVISKYDIEESEIRDIKIEKLIK